MNFNRLQRFIQTVSIVEKGSHENFRQLIMWAIFSAQFVLCNESKEIFNFFFFLKCCEQQTEIPSSYLDGLIFQKALNERSFIAFEKKRVYKSGVHPDNNVPNK